MTNRALELLLAFTVSATAWIGLAMIGIPIHNSYAIIDMRTTIGIET